jgi:hypothetical protein
MEDDIIGRWLILKGPVVFLLVGLAFWALIGAAMFYIPKWIALAVGLAAFASGAVAVTFWAAVIFGAGIETISGAVTLAMVAAVLVGLGWNFAHRPGAS